MDDARTAKHLLTLCHIAGSVCVHCKCCGKYTQSSLGQNGGHCYCWIYYWWENAHCKRLFGEEHTWSVWDQTWRGVLSLSHTLNLHICIIIENNGATDTRCLCNLQIITIIMEHTQILFLTKRKYLNLFPGWSDRCSSSWSNRKLLPRSRSSESPEAHRKNLSQGLFNHPLLYFDYEVGELYNSEITIKRWWPITRCYEYMI